MLLAHGNKGHGSLIRLTVILSVVAVIIVLLIPTIQKSVEQVKVRTDQKSIERVYNTLQELINDDTIINKPASLWNANLTSLEEISSIKEFSDRLKDKLNVTNLGNLEGDGFKSRAYKGSKYNIYMYEGEKKIHLIVVSNYPDEYEDIVY